MTKKQPPNNNDPMPEADEEGLPTQEEHDPFRQWIEECVEGKTPLFCSMDEEFMKIFNEMLDRFLPPGGGIDLEEWGKDGTHTMH